MGTDERINELIDAFSSAIQEALMDSIEWEKTKDGFEVDFDFVTDYLRDFAVAIKDAVTKNIIDVVKDTLYIDNGIQESM